MKRRRSILFLMATVVTLVIATAFFLGRSAPQPTVIGHLRPEDPPQIQRAVSRYRWTLVRESLAGHDFKYFFSSPFFRTVGGQVREIGAMPDRPINGFGQSITNPSTAAYAISRRPRSQHSLRYHLRRTTNEWAIVPPVIYR